MCTLAGEGVVLVHYVSWPTGADEAGAVQVGALLLAQLLLTVAIIAEIWSRTTQSMFSESFQTTSVCTFRDMS